MSSTANRVQTSLCRNPQGHEVWRITVDGRVVASDIASDADCMAIAADYRREASGADLIPFRVTYRLRPRSRKTSTGITFHRSEADARAHWSRAREEQGLGAILALDVSDEDPRQ